MARTEVREDQPSVRAPAHHLVGRERERAAIDRLLEHARTSHGGVLAMHGEPGVGKTALLHYAVHAGQGFRIEQTVGVEAEMELPYAAAQQLCSTMLELMVDLPGPQRDALGVAFGLHRGPTPDPFLIGLAVLGLVSEAAEERPLTCDCKACEPADGFRSTAV